MADKYEFTSRCCVRAVDEWRYPDAICAATAVYHSMLDRLAEDYKRSHEDSDEVLVTRIRSFNAGVEFIKNAYDSIVMRQNKGESGYSGEIVMTLLVEDGVIRFELADNGIGIDEGIGELVYERLVSPKWDAPELGVPITGGYGRGLYVYRTAIEAKGGSVGFENLGKNVGARFWFELPLDYYLASPDDVDALKERDDNFIQELMDTVPPNTPEDSP